MQGKLEKGFHFQRARTLPKGNTRGASQATIAEEGVKGFNRKTRVWITKGKVRDSAKRVPPTCKEDVPLIFQRRSVDLVIQPERGISTFFN